GCSGGCIELESGEFAAIEAVRSGDPFCVLVVATLSRSSNERSPFLAFKRLKMEWRLSLRVSSRRALRGIAEAIRVAGLWG
ncbi:MAG: hypothetical protein QXO02_10630, partial [Thermofilaceae archaeon]